MPLVKPAVSKELLQMIERAEVMHGFIQTTAPDRFVLDTDERMLVVALYSLVEEHHAAILYLLRAGQFDGSALALARPLVDAAYRAHWIYSCAKPEIIQRIKAGENCYPRAFIDMADAIEEKMATGGLFTSIKPYIQALHGYTHGGLEQLGRRFDGEGNVRATYTDGEKQEVVNATTAHFTALAIAWCQLISGGSQKDEPCSVLIGAKYAELYAPVDAAAVK